MELGNVWIIHPLFDDRWPEFVDQHANSSVFHTTGWLTALRTTYGYEPIALTTSPPSEKLTNAILFCVVRSWLTRDRLVSLPFTDHCEPLVQNIEQLQTLYAHLERLRKVQRGTYAEIRTSEAILGIEKMFQEYKVYLWHRLDLRPSLDILYEGFHKSCIRGRIRHAERQGLTYYEGRSESLIRSFYELVVLTRSRKHLPTQPFEWFQRLVTSMGKDICIRMAFKRDQAVAGILTMNHGRTVYYKYGGSDACFHHLGATPMLFWQAIQAAKLAGMEALDFGRSDVEDQGLIMFKERWGAQSVRLTLWRSPVDKLSLSFERMKTRLAKTVCSYVPYKMLVLAGRLMYRHIG
ncbi:MAG: peptidoglycan bridge formation glycyltransferase FemA/FemB family protein [Nitrospira sp.]|nr:peptidoglycan bridge formation glycyltransferase FemA/FemB family protein [Nitrospira sp.]